MGWGGGMGWVGGGRLDKSRLILAIHVCKQILSFQNKKTLLVQNLCYVSCDIKNGSIK